MPKSFTLNISVRSPNPGLPPRSRLPRAAFTQLLAGALLAFGLIFVCPADAQTGTGSPAVSKDESANAAANGSQAASDAPLSESLTAIERNALDRFRRKPLVAAVTISPPYVELDASGAVSGYAVEHLRLLASRLDLEVEFVLEDTRADVLSAVRLRMADIAARVVPSAERAAYMRFTKPYLSLSMVIFTRTDVPVVSALFELTGRRVALVEDGVAHRALSSDFARIELLPLESEEEALRAVAEGRAFAYIGGLLSASTSIANRRFDNLKLSGLSGYPSRSVAIGVRSDLSELPGLLDRARASLSIDELAELHRTQLQVDRGTGLTYEELLTYVLAPAFVVGLVLVAGFAWNRSLQREVRMRESAEHELLERFRNEQLLRQVSDRFSSVQPVGLDSAVDAALAGFGRHYGADRAAFARFDKEGAKVANVWYEAPVPGAGRRLRPGMRFEQADEDWHWLLVLMRQRKAFTCRSLDELPAQAEGTRRWFEAQGAEAFMALPVQAGAKLLGIIGVAGRRRSMPWPDSTVGAGLLIGGIVGSAIGRLNNERALIGARDAAEQGERTKAAFLAAMSHEIRTPMNGVVGMIDLLGRSRLDPEQRKMLATTRESSFALLRVIDDVLDFSKIEAGKLGLERVSTSLAELVESVTETLWTSAAARRVKLLCYVDPYLPDRVFVDPVRIRQILFNLIGNAIKFSDGGLVRVHALWEPGIPHDDAHEGPTGCALLKVIDTGIGMSAEQLASLFEPFSQAESSTTRRFGGTGLGLAICHNLIELMAGEMHVHSEAGEGSTFAARIPVTVDESGSTTGTDDEDMDVIDGLHVLVVTDDEKKAWFMGRYLERWGAGFETEYKPQAVTERVDAAARQRRPFDVVVMGEGWDLDDAARLECLGSSARSAPRPDAMAGVAPGAVLLVRRTGQRLNKAKYRPAVAVASEPLRRSEFLNAVAIAAGRASQEADSLDAGAHAVTPEVPSVEPAQVHDELILVAEDNETNRLVMVRQLAALGYAAEVVDNGERALAAWRTGRFALLLTDCHMPSLDGYQLSRRIREEELRQGQKRIPIVAVTASALEGDEQRCLGAGMDGYLAKPIETEKLNSVLRFLLTGSAASQAEPVNRPAASNGEFDPRVLASMIGDDPEAIVDIMRTFVRDARGCISELGLAASAGSGEIVRANAHKLKSSSRAVGANRLAHVCQTLESAARREDWAAIRAGLRSLEPALAAVRAPNEDPAGSAMGATSQPSYVSPP